MEHRQVRGDEHLSQVATFVLAFSIYVLRSGLRIEEVGVILVTGGTGNVGRTVVELLLQRDERVRALTRKPAAALFPPGVEAVQGDPSDEDAVATALDGVDAVLLIVPGESTAVVKSLQHIVPERVVLLSSITAASRPQLVYADTMRERELSIRAAAPHATILQPGQFASNALWWKPMIATGVVTAPFGDVAMPVIDPADIAAVAASALVDDAHRGTVLHLSGPELVSTRQRVEQVAAALGRPLRFVEQSESEFRAASTAMPPHLLDYLVAVQSRPTMTELTIFPTVQTVTGHAPGTFLTWAHQHRDLLAA